MSGTVQFNDSVLTVLGDPGTECRMRGGFMLRSSLEERVYIAFLYATVLTTAWSKLTKVNTVFTRVMANRGRGQYVMAVRCGGTRLLRYVGVERMRSTRRRARMVRL